jgi:hypothetical protein
MHGAPEVAGIEGDSGYDLTLWPGATYTLSPSVAFEANVPIVVAEDASPDGKSWGIWASVYYTLPL